MTPPDARRDAEAVEADIILSVQQLGLTPCACPVAPPVRCFHCEWAKNLRRFLDEYRDHAVAQALERSVQVVTSAEMIERQIADRKGEPHHYAMELLQAVAQTIREEATLLARGRGAGT